MRDNIPRDSAFGVWQPRSRCYCCWRVIVKPNDSIRSIGPARSRCLVSDSKKENNMGVRVSYLRRMHTERECARWW